VGVAPRPAADVEQPHARLEGERIDEEVHLLRGALRERVAQVGVAEVVGDGLEPVVGPVGRIWPDGRVGGVGHRRTIVARPGAGPTSGGHRSRDVLAG
jgi:hypothetical protein